VRTGLRTPNYRHRRGVGSWSTGVGGSASARTGPTGHGRTGYPAPDSPAHAGELCASRHSTRLPDHGWGRWRLFALVYRPDVASLQCERTKQAPLLQTRVCGLGQIVILGPLSLQGRVNRPPKRAPRVGRSLINRTSTPLLSLMVGSCRRPETPLTLPRAVNGRITGDGRAPSERLLRPLSQDGSRLALASAFACFPAIPSSPGLTQEYACREVCVGSV
jgi:hypothetical protein